MYSKSIWINPVSAGVALYIESSQLICTATLNGLKTSGLRLIWRIRNLDFFSDLTEYILIYKESIQIKTGCNIKS